MQQVDDAKPLPDGTPGPPTHFSIDISATCNASSVVAVPSTFSGSITGACSLTGSIRDEAVCLVADAKKSRWTVRQDHDTYPSGSTSSQTQQYPPASGPRDTVLKGPNTEETALDASSNVPEHSSVTYNLLETPGQGDKSGEKQRARRHVVYDSDYNLGLDKLETIENNHRRWTRKFIFCYLLSCLSWIIFIYSMVNYFDGPSEAFFALTLMPLGVSIVAPMVVIGEAWTMYYYKPPSIGTV